MLDSNTMAGTNKGQLAGLGFILAALLFGTGAVIGGKVAIMVPLSMMFLAIGIATLVRSRKPSA